LTFIEVRKPKLQLGVDIDFYTYPGENVRAAAESTLAYVKSLGANAVSISFPVFEAGPRSSRVRGTDATPSAEDIAIVASVAEKAGLYVSVRPLLDSGSIRGLSRTAWRPSNPAIWFASYQAFLLPYAQMAQHARIPELINGAELNKFQTLPSWRGLDKALRRVYRGVLAYSNNWGIPIVPSAGGLGAQETVDVYKPMKVSVNASVARLTRGWAAYDRTIPSGTVETEVGIAAVPGAYRVPYKFNWNQIPLAPSIQTRWFTAACNAAATSHLGGIYFWVVGLGQALNVPPGPSNPASWTDGPGARAISACFSRWAARPEVSVGEQRDSLRQVALGARIAGRPPSCRNGTIRPSAPTCGVR
jgi:hypothetical protein